MNEMKEEPVGRGDELKRALTAIRDLRKRIHDLEHRTSEPVAIIGMSCRLPGGADSPERLWDLLRNGVDATSYVPPDRWDADAIYNPDPEAPGGVYVRRGGFLTGPIDQFDPSFFGISPREAAGMDPMQRMLLELAWEALERACIPPFTLANSLTGVYTGLSVSDYDLLQQTSGLDAIHSYRGTGTTASVAVGRISHFLGLQGPNFPVDTACSSGLVALVLAVEHLRTGRCNLALAGSVNLMLAPQSTVLLCRMRALSPDGRCRTFDASASGYARGEGGGMLVLKRLSDALADEDPILAVIRGVACNHDGRSSGLTVPNPMAQKKVIEAALRDAGMNPQEIDYIEAHGTATQLGDPIELRALSEVLCRDRGMENPLILGAVKTNLGHLEASAGITGVLKVVESLRHRQIPPHLHLIEPTPHVDWAKLPLRIQTELCEWPRGDTPRAAGVSAFGFSGTNAHIIIGEAPGRPEPTEKPKRPVAIVALSGRSAKAVQELAGLYAAHLEASGDGAIADLSVTSTKNRSHLPYRATAAGGSLPELLDSLRALQASDGESITQVRSVGAGPIAFLFTGQGSQSPAMAGELWDSSPAFRTALQQCAEMLEPDLDLLPLLLDEARADELNQTCNTQPAMFAFEYALAQLWLSWGIEPSYVVGHSLGEYVAATVSGVMELSQALPLVAARGRLMQSLPAGGRMVSVFGTDRQVIDALDGADGVTIAAFNGPRNVVVSGEGDSVAQVVRRLQATGIDTCDLIVSHAFHSPLMEPILDEFEQALRRVELRAPGIDILSNVTGDIMSDAEAVDAARWRRHLREPVRFATSMARLAELGVRCFIEIGPHPTLAGLGSETVTATDVLWLPSMRRGKPAWRQLADSVAQLYKSGYDVDWSGWCRDHQGRAIIAPTYPFQRERYWFTDIVGAASSPVKRLSGSPTGPRAGHPLLGTVLKSPALNGWVFQRDLELRQPEYLHQHRVFGHAVAPGALFVEMLLAALAEGPGWDSSRIANLAFEKPLVIPEDAAVTCQVIVGTETNGQVLLRVVSAAPAGGPDAWVTHASGLGQRLDSPLPATRSLDALRTEATREVNVGDIYARVEKRGMEYGPAFRPMVSCRTGDRMAVGEAQLATAVAQQAADYGIHPCLLDAGLTLLASLSHDSNDEDATATWLPMGMDDIRFLQPLSPACSVYGTVRADSNADTTVADLVFFDDRGIPCLEVIGYRARRADTAALRAALGGAAGASPVYRIEWQPVDAPGASGELAGTWLLLEDQSAIGASVAAALGQQGARCIRIRQGAEWSRDGDRMTVPPADDQVWQRVLNAAGITNGQEVRGIVHLWALDAKASGSTAEENVLSRALDPCMPLVTLLGRELSPAPSMLRIVTRGATGPDGASAAAWDAGAALWGLFPVIRAEHPEIDSRIVDLDPCAAQSAADWLLVSLFGESAEDRLAFRGTAVLAPRLVDDKASEEADIRQIPQGEGYRIDIAKRGTLDALRYLPALRTVPGPGEAEVRIRVAGLNFRDVLNVLGMYPGDPGQPGVEFAGVVCRVAADVTHVQVGDEIVGIGTGAFGRYTTVRAAGLIRIPGGLSMEEAATIPLAFLTAEWGLAHLANLRKNERVLIHAAAGGVGQAAVQLSMALGADVFATAGSEEKRNFLKAQGVRHIYSSRDPSFADEVLRATNGEGVHVVLNALTGDMLRRSLELLREGGRFIELGKAEVLEPAEIAARYPGIRYEAFDLGSVLVDTPEQFQAMFASVARRFDSGELTGLPVRSFDAEHVIDAFRYMAQARHIGKITVTSGSPTDRHSTSIRPDAAYIVTGGTGALGRQVVEWLANQGAGAIVVNARSALSDETSAWIEELRARGTRIQWVQGDVARPADVARLLHDAADGRMPIAGVWHTAGTLDDVLLHEQKRERFFNVLAPKVLGAWNLHNATKTLELDHFVLFSSIASLLGGPGQSSYSPANAVLTALAERRGRSGLPALSIEWGAWEGSGMAGRLGDRERRVIEESGMRFLKADSAFAAMGHLLSCHAPRRIVADIDWKQIRLVTRTPPPLLRARLAGWGITESAAQPGPAAAFHPSELEGLEAPAVEAKLTDYILMTLSGVLGARSGQIKPDTQISDFGFDSLMAMELRNRIETQVGVLVPVSKLLTSSTPAGLAVDLATLIGVTEPVAAQNRPDGWVEGEI